MGHVGIMSTGARIALFIIGVLFVLFVLPFLIWGVG